MLVTPRKFVGIMRIKFVRIDKLIGLGSKEYFFVARNKLFTKIWNIKCSFV